MASRLSIRGATSTTPSMDHSKAQRDEVSKIQQDINILTQKIAELNGEPVPQMDDNSSAASPFVVGLRALADSERKFKDVKELKINTLEKLLEKVSEYDRILLKETAPVVDPTVIPQRRKSFGQDLFCLPTHMHLTARLMDLHSASKRVTVIKMTEQGAAAPSSGTPPLNPTDKKLIEGLKTTVAKQAKQIEEAEKSRSHTEEVNEQLKRSNTELKRVNEDMKTENDALRAQLTALQSKPAPAPIVPVVAPAPAPQPAPAPAVVDCNSAEIPALKARVIELEKALLSTQERLEIDSGHLQSMISVTLGKANRLNNHIALDGKGDDCINLVGPVYVNFTGLPLYTNTHPPHHTYVQPADARNAMQLLERAINTRFSSLQAELSLMMSLKDLLEGERKRV